jgi:hypothetical protein
MNRNNDTSIQTSLSGAHIPVLDGLMSGSEHVVGVENSRESAPILKPATICVCGSFGYGNAGDEAVPLAIADMAASLGVQLHIDVLTRFSNPPSAGIVGTGSRYAQQREDLLDRPILLCGGGIVEPNETCVLSKCGELIRRNREGAAIFAGSVEHGVKYGWLRRRRIARLLRHMRGICVRDELSAEALARIVPERTSEIEVVGDCVLWLAADDTYMMPEEAGEFIAVTLCPRWSGSEAWHGWIAGQLAEVAQHLACAVVFVPFSVQHDDDRAEHRIVQRRLKEDYPRIRAFCVEEALSPRQLKGVLGRASAVVGMRLHACVMAYAAERPCVALGYHPKIHGFARTVGGGVGVMPAEMPGGQTADYGYSFETSGLREHRLLPCVAAAMERRDFGRLGRLKAKLVDAFVRVLRIADGSEARCE